MKARPRIGTTGEKKFTVDRQHAIDIADDPASAVLSTPWLIWFLEHAAREAVSATLEPGETTVGTLVNVEHLAATPIGHEVTCRARIIHVDGSAITFQVSAADPYEKVARGLHKRRVVRSDRFRASVRKKITTSGSA